jgi:hypothetical protein
MQTNTWQGRNYNLRWEALWSEGQAFLLIHWCPCTCQSKGNHLWVRFPLQKLFAYCVLSLFLCAWVLCLRVGLDEVTEPFFFDRGGEKQNYDLVLRLWMMYDAWYVYEKYAKFLCYRRT